MMVRPSLVQPAVFLLALVAVGCGGEGARPRDTGRRDAVGPEAADGSGGTDSGADAGDQAGEAGQGGAGGSEDARADGDRALDAGDAAVTDLVMPPPLDVAPGDLAPAPDAAGADAAETTPDVAVMPDADPVDLAPAGDADPGDMAAPDLAPPAPDVPAPVDMAAPDVAPPPPDVAPDLVADAAPDTAPDLAPDAAPFRPVRLSETDKSAEVELSPNRLAMDQFTLRHQGVRSDTSIAPGSGLFYYEAARHVEARFIELGVATGAVALDVSASDTPGAVVVDSGGSVGYAGATAGFHPESTHYGFVVDYRQSHPIVHAIALDGGKRPAIVFTANMTSVHEPLFIFLGGLRRMVGYQASINPGNDVVNFPFTYDPVALLQAAQFPGASDLVLGWGGSHRGAFNQPPTVAASADVSVALGGAVTVTATASDPEDGALTGSIRWQDLAAPLRPGVGSTGGSFTFTPSALGVHPMRATVTDSGGKVATATVRVTVTGTLPTFSPVRLVPDAKSGAGIELTADGLGARFTHTLKMGIRANQGLLRGFQYFEFRRERAPINMGGGLVIAEGNLAPFDQHDVPPSVALNTLGGTAYNLTLSEGGFTQEVAATASTYGFAVDYRADFPTVYIIVGNQIVDVIPMPDVTVPIYPLLYGNDTTPGSGPDETINFGASPFQYDARAILEAAGVDVTGFTARWGP